MNLINILNKYKNEEYSLNESIELIQSLGYINVSNISKIDIYREKRTGFIEAILAEGKSVEDLLEIIETYLKNKDRVLITRVNKNQ